jgi:hypothetical protein
MVNNVIGVVNYVIAPRPSLLKFMIADSKEKVYGSIRACPTGCVNDVARR